jgi:hypothetical protein
MAPLPSVSHVASGAIQSLPHFQNVDRKSDEGWDSFVARAAVETLAYLRAFNAKSIEDLYINVTWSEAEFQNLDAGGRQGSPRFSKFRKPKRNETSPAQAMDVSLHSRLLFGV